MSAAVGTAPLGVVDAEVVEPGVTVRVGDPDPDCGTVSVLVVTVDGGVCGEPVVADDGFAVVRGVVVAVVVAVVVGPEGVAVADGGAGVVVAEEDTGVVDVVVVGSGEVDVFSVIGESGEPAAPVGVA